MVAAPDTIHATCIAVGGRAALLRGPSGSGKSDLALRCLMLAPTPITPQAAVLVADDRVVLRRDAQRLIASPPASIAGKLEVRGLGILTWPIVAEAEVVLIADLDPSCPAVRLPDPHRSECLLGVPLPVLGLRPFESSAAQKLVLALREFGVAGLP